MSEANAIPNVSEKQIQADAITGSVLDWTVGPVLNAQAEILADAEATIGDWVRRRHEAVADTRQLIASLHPAADPAAVLRAQQEWASRSFRRLAADADACHSLARRIVGSAQSWFPRGGWACLPPGMGSADASASQAAATRAAGKPLRMADRSD